ncbi:MAG: hypothetical protein JJU06_10490 [Ectothiorhodospiraceae bacterium]|nr:hypothetical protein [Ectothiorhodospiraceae bacterium]
MARNEQSREQVPYVAPESIVLMELEARRLRDEYIAACVRSGFSRARVWVSGMLENAFSRNGNVSREA